MHGNIDGPRATVSGRRQVMIASLPAVASVVVFVSTATRLFTMGSADIAGRYMADDAFYYLVLADRFPTPEFSTGIVTTGFHPLWWLMLSPIEAIADGVTVLRFALLLVIAVHISTGFVLRALFREWWSAPVAAVAATAWIIHPAVRSIGMMGVESSVVALTIALLLWATTQPVTDRAAVRLGLIVGAAFLARADSLLVTAPIALVWLYAAGARRLVISASSALGIVLPWVVFLLLTGGLSQDSSTALIIVREAMGTFQPSGEVLDPFIRTFGNLGVSGLWRELPGPSELLLVPVTYLLTKIPMRRTEVGLLGGTVLVCWAQAWHLGQMREWYSIYLLFAMVVLLAPRTAVAVTKIPMPTLRPTLPAVAILATVTFGVIDGPNWFPQEAAKYNAALRVGSQFEPAARFAAFNAGIYQWVMPQDVVNLDGVVNPDVLPHLTDRSVCSYITAQEIDWLIDSANGHRKAEVFAPGLLTEERSTRIPVKGDPQFLWALNPRTC